MLNLEYTQSFIKACCNSHRVWNSRLAKEVYPCHLCTFHFLFVLATKHIEQVGWIMWSVECGKCRVWKMQGVENAECKK